MVEQVAAERARAQGHHDIVHGDTERPLDGLGVAERKRAEGEAPVARDGAVPRRVRRGTGRKRHVRRLVTVREQTHPSQPGHRARHHLAGRGVAGERGHRPEQAQLQLQCLARPGGVVDQRAAEQLNRRGHALRLERRARRIDDATLDVGVEQDLQQLDTGRAVDRRVVDLGEQADHAVLEPADDVQLPQRARPVERSRHDARHLLAELLLVAG
jgi:hypothetical protein